MFHDHRAPIAVIIVAGRVPGVFPGYIFYQSVLLPACLQSSSVDKGFEGRPRLAVGLDGPVELRLDVITAAYHGPDEAGLGVDSNQRSLEFLLGKGLFSSPLVIGVEGGVDPKSSPINQVGAVALLQLFLDII